MIIFLLQSVTYNMYQAPESTRYSTIPKPTYVWTLPLMSLLRQPSSAIVERAFSQVNYIRSLCGDKLKEDNLEIRAMLRCDSNCDACDY